MKSTQKTRKVHGQCKSFALGTQHNLYSTDSRWGFALGDAKKFALPNAKDTNMLVYFALGNAKVLSFALGNAKVPNTNGFASQWNIGLRLPLVCV